MESTPSVKHTPLMEQYHEIKASYPSALLLFQVGDFYELFFDDAKKASAFLGITLTARGKTGDGEAIPLCGVPVHTKDHYVAKLVKGGFHVALCDQLEPSRTGCVVKRGVTQVLTPGTLTDTHLLDAKSASYLCSFFPMHDRWALLFGELLTAQLYATVIASGDTRALDAELSRFLPDEIILPATKTADMYKSIFQRSAYAVTPIQAHGQGQSECEDNARQWMQQQFGTTYAQSIEHQESLRLALYCFYVYVQKNQPKALDHFKSIYLYDTDDFLRLDQATQCNLELVKDTNGGTKNTLCAVIDGAVTPMGSRMIKKWLLRPLVKHKPIVQRQDVISLFMSDIVLMQRLSDLLSAVGDIERVIGRIALARAGLADYNALLKGLLVIPEIKRMMQDYTRLPLVSVIYDHISDFSSLTVLLSASLNDDISQDWIIKKGFDHHLDQLRELVHNTHQNIVAMERAEQEATGITSLKIRYNQIHGYYIEVTKMHMHAIPVHYMRQQTLVGRERYITPTLQELQHEILTARATIDRVEQEVFDRINRETVSRMHYLRKLSYALAHLDALIGFAQVSYTHRYTRPLFNDQRTICIQAGRHPVVERSHEIVFIPNDTLLSDDESVLIITGPNMGGKSTYLRQVALIVILAQTGCFVPAVRAELFLIDRVFTRIGAGDNLAEGKSTFLVEMEETATICRDATRNSFVILDEVGRGTSTYDGLSIAQAVIEYIHTIIGTRCLFATHYHELTLLQNTVPGIKSYHMSSNNASKGIVFLYTLIRGVAAGSFGIEVAKLASLPSGVITRAQELLNMLSSTNNTSAHAVLSNGRGDYQIMQTHDRLSIDSVLTENAQLKCRIEYLETQATRYQRLSSIQIDDLSPKMAFDVLWDVLKEKQ